MAKTTDVSYSVLLLHEGETTTLRLLERGFQYLASTRGISFRVEDVRDAAITVGESEIPIFIRSAKLSSAGIAEQLIASGKKYATYFDDDFWALSLRTDLGRYYRSPESISAMRLILSGSSLNIVSSEVLANRVSDIAGFPATLVPPHFDFSLIEQGANKGATLGQESSSISPVVIGFASNHSRLSDLAFIEPILKRVLDTYSQVELEFIGLTPTQLRLGDRVRAYPHLDSYLDYIKFQQSRNWHIGLAPLRNTKQNAAKTNNKFREYSAMGIPGVFSDLPPYREVENGVTGFKAGWTSRAWLDRISALVADEDLREKLRDNARQHVRSHYDLSAVMPIWHQLLSEVARDDVGIVNWYGNPRHPESSRIYFLWYLYRSQGFYKASKHLLKLILGVQ